MLKGNIEALPVINYVSFTLTLESNLCLISKSFERWETESMEAVNERDPSNYESIQRVNGRGGERNDKWSTRVVDA